MVVGNDHEIFLNHEYKGLFRLFLDEDFTKIDSINILKPLGFDSSIVKFDDEILYSTKQGVFELGDRVV